MRTKDFNGLMAHRTSREVPRLTRLRREDNPSVGVALLGLVCVVGLFGCLGLLYSLG